MKTALTFILVLLSFSIPVQSMGRVTSESNQGLIGQTAPDFTLPTISGTTQTFSKIIKDKKTILFFWATWCPHCHDNLVKIWGSREELKAKGIQVVLVDVGEEKNQVKAYLEYNRFEGDCFIDADMGLQETYRLYGVPTLFFIDENGIVRGQTNGFPGNAENFFSGSS